jgi:hypothetical protein
MSFNKPPLAPEDKEKKAEAFINLMDQNIVPIVENPRIFNKEKTKGILIRFPLSLIDDLKEISALSGISINSICLEILRPNIKKKLKELKDYRS